ncbi:MAG: toprim domain-containing protein [Nitrososphaerota archaeon]|nr:toprim domain-containing protein [Nitrososphaerota archaeon]
MASAKNLKERVRAGERTAFKLRQIMQDLSTSDTLLVVEGKNDNAAVRELGYTGAIFEMCGSGGGTKNLAVLVQDYKNLVILFDTDKRGERLERTVKSKMTYAGINIDYHTRMRIRSITGGISHIEDLIKFAGYLNWHQGNL